MPPESSPQARIPGFTRNLQYEDQSVSNTFADIDKREISGNVIVGATVKQGESAEGVEKTINDILQEFLEKGPSQDELDRIRSEYFSGFLKGIERIGGFGGKSDILATNQVYGGSPDYYKKVLKDVSEATVEEIQRVCKEYLGSGKYVLVCKPFPSLSASATGVDRKKLPDLGAPVPSSFPSLQKATLKNGMNVTLVQRKGIPTIVGILIVNGGFSTDVLSKPGMASLAMDLLDEGTKNLSSLQINEKLQLLGASISTRAGLDVSTVIFSTLTQTFNPTLDILSDVILNPAFSQKEFDRLKKEHLDNILQEKSEPFGIAVRVFPRILYGAGHPYSNPLGGSGYQSTVEAISLDEIRNYYSTWFKPNNSTLIIVGDVEMQNLIPALETKLAAWKKGDVPKNPIPQIKGGAGKKIYLIDRPESSQSIVLAGYLIGPYGQVFQPALEALNNVLGGDFISRLNMNLREDKHWSYGAGSFVMNARGQRPLLAYVSVQMDKTKESIQEIQKELTAIIADKPVTTDEFNRVQKNMILQLPGMWETNSSVASSMVEKVMFGLPDDYFKTYDSKIRNLSGDELQKLTKVVILPDQVTYFVVGDKSKIIDSLKETGYEIIEVDADGNLLK